jgi:hypothetical protein
MRLPRRHGSSPSGATGRGYRRIVGAWKAHRLMVSVGGLVLLLSLTAAALHQRVLTREPGPSAVRVSFQERAQRAFSPDSWWNTPLPDEPPLHPHDTEILTYLATGPESRDGCLRLAGVHDRWGIPTFWSVPADPTYRVTSTGHVLPPEFGSLRIPHDAEPAANTDGNMTIYDFDKGYVVALEQASYDADREAWSASGGTVSYLDSNGLEVRTGRSDDRRNRGTHRGNNAAVMAVSVDQVNRGAVEHVLKMAAGPPVADRHVFPMVGSDGTYRGSDPGIPAQGTRLRIKPTVDLDSVGLRPQALVIARALQRYGTYIGDSGGSTALKVEDTSAEGRGDMWNLEPDSLCALPFDARFWDVLAEGYDPTRSPGTTDGAATGALEGQP